jgi:hypothetical protein
MAAVVALGDPADTTDTQVPAPPVVAAPPAMKSRVATAPVSELHAGAPIMVGADTPDDVADDIRGDGQPTVPGEPWTIPTSPLAVLGPVQGGWALPVDGRVNGQPPTGAMVSTAERACRAPAAWTNSFGRAVTGQVLDPAVTPELTNIPAGIERVVIAADDPAEPVDRLTRGSPVTAQIDGIVENLGIVTGVDPGRRWVVVDLVGPFLSAQRAQLLTTG